MYNSIKVKVYCKNKHNFINTRKNGIINGNKL